MRVKNESGHPFVRMTEGAIGFDLRACINTERYIQPGQRFKFDTGISIELPEGWGAFVQPRSGLGLNHGVVALTGVIDRDYRGRIAVVLVNHGSEPFKVMPGDRIAQLVPVHTPPIDVVLDVSELSMTDRGGSGFGSTGR